MKKLMTLALVGSLVTTTHARPTAASIGAGITAGAVAMGAMLKISYDAFKKANPDSKMSLREYIVDFAKKNPEWVALYAIPATMTGVLVGGSIHRATSSTPTTSTQGQEGTSTSPDASTPSNATDTSDTSSATTTSTTATSEIPTSSTAPAESTGNADPVQNTDAEDQRRAQQEAALEKRKAALAEEERKKLEEQSRQADALNATNDVEQEALRKKAAGGSSTDASATTTPADATPETPAEPKANPTDSDAPKTGTENAPATTDPKTPKVVTDPAATQSPTETSTATTVPTSTPLPRSKSSSTVAKPGDSKSPTPRNASTPDLRRPTYSKDAEMKTLAALVTNQSKALRDLKDLTSTAAEKIADEVTKPNALLGLFGAQQDQHKKDIAFYRAYIYLQNLGPKKSYSEAELARAKACAEAAVKIEINDTEKAADLFTRITNETPADIAQYHEYINKRRAFRKLIHTKVEAISPDERTTIDSELKTLSKKIENNGQASFLSLEKLITQQNKSMQTLVRETLVLALHKYKTKVPAQRTNFAFAAYDKLVSTLSNKKELAQKSEAEAFKAVFGIDA